MANELVDKIFIFEKRFENRTDSAFRISPNGMPIIERIRILERKKSGTIESESRRDTFTEVLQLERTERKISVKSAGGADNGAVKLIE